MDFQIRLRVDEPLTSIEYIKHWLDMCTEGFAFEHDLVGNHHYHIYLFGLDRKPDPMRKHLGKYISNKERYAVGITAGKKKVPITKEIAYQYGTTNELLNPIWVKGFDDNQMEVLKMKAEAFYKQSAERQLRKNQVVTEILVIHDEKVKPDRVWERLMSDIIEAPDTYDGKSVPQIKSIISVQYLRRLKAIPRPSDLHRYAVSLFYITKYGLHTLDNPVIEDDALVEEYLR